MNSVVQLTVPQANLKTGDIVRLNGQVFGHPALTVLRVSRPKGGSTLVAVGWFDADMAFSEVELEEACLTLVAQRENPKA
jgi:hypothetical protein